MIHYIKECDVSSVFTSTPDRDAKIVILARTEDQDVASVLLRNLRSMNSDLKHVTWMEEFP